MRILLDTHALVYWVSEPGRLSAAQRHAVMTVSPDNPAIVADISLWEVAMLATSGRLRLGLPIRDWLTSATAPPLVRLAEISPSIAAEVADLAHWDHRDPADRLVVATARVYGATIVTNDAEIRSAGIVATV